jgi:hypothetical protein
MSHAREQASTFPVSIRAIVASREFARGLDEVRKGLPFNPDNDDPRALRSKKKCGAAVLHA